MRHFLFGIAFCVLLSLACGSVDADQAAFRLQAMNDHRQAQDVAGTNPLSKPMKLEAIQARLRLARACFDLAEFSTNNAERIVLAEEGIAAAKSTLALTNTSSGHYYLGLNLGQLARTRSLGALRLVDQMEREFLDAIALDPKIDYAGPHRSLGLLYREAPSIASVGSRSKAKEHLQQAATLAPGFPENRLNLIESYLDWGDRSATSREWKELQQMWPKAREQFTGPKWLASWHDWNARYATVQGKIQQAGKALSSPRDS